MYLKNMFVKMAKKTLKNKAIGEDSSCQVLE